MGSRNRLSPAPETWGPFVFEPPDKPITRSQSDEGTNVNDKISTQGFRCSLTLLLILLMRHVVEDELVS